MEPSVSLRLRSVTWLATAGVPVAWFAFVGRYGWSDTDDGFILALAWRVVNGEVPYRDFVYVRPPMSPLLHSVWFHLVPEAYVFAAARLVVIAQLWISAVVAAFLCTRTSGDSVLRRRWRWFAAAGFLLSVTAFTPMPWHTIDGVFFASLAAFAALHGKGPVWKLAAAPLATASALAKQSFYPVPLLVLATLILLRQWRASAWFASGVVACVITLYIGASQFGVVDPFIVQTTAAASLGDAFHAGIVSYTVVGGRLLLYAAAAAVALRLIWRARHVRYSRHIDLSVLLTVATAMLAGEAVRTGRWAGDNAIGLGHALLVVAIVGVVRRRHTGSDVGIVALCLSVAWLSSLSWGFATPMLFATPLLIGAYHFVADTGGLSGRRMWAHATLVVAFTVAATVHPYLDGRRDHLRCDLGQVEPKLSFIVTTPDNCRRVSELRATLARLPDTGVTVLPASPLTYFLSDRANPLPLDWPMVVEAGDAMPRVTVALREQTRLAVVARSTQGPTPYGDGPYSVPPLARVIESWIPVLEGEYFVVYQNPDRPDIRE